MLLLSIICAVVFYGLVVFAVGYALNKEEIAAAMEGSGLVTAFAMEKVFNSAIMAKVLIIGGLCGVITSWNSFLIGGSRAIFSMAESKMIPGSGATLTWQEFIIVGGWALLGIIFYVMCKLKYKHEFGHIEI